MKRKRSIWNVEETVLFHLPWKWTIHVLYTHTFSFSPCVQLANVFTRNLFSRRSFFFFFSPCVAVGQPPMVMTNARRRRRESERNEARYVLCHSSQGRESEREKRERDKIVHLFHWASAKLRRLKFIEINESHVLYVTKTTTLVSMRLLFQQWFMSYEQWLF